MGSRRTKPGSAPGMHWKPSAVRPAGWTASPLRDGERVSADARVGHSAHASGRRPKRLARQPARLTAHGTRHSRRCHVDQTGCRSGRAGSRRPRTSHSAARPAARQTDAALSEADRRPRRHQEQKHFIQRIVGRNRRPVKSIRTLNSGAFCGYNQSPSLILERNTSVIEHELFTPPEANPIIKPSDLPYPCDCVCNPAAHIVDDEVLLLLRVIDQEGSSHITVARSQDGITDWRIETTPLLHPSDRNLPFETYGCEDPRLVYLEDRGEYASPTPATRRWARASASRPPRISKPLTASAWSSPRTTKTPPCSRARSAANTGCCTARRSVPGTYLADRERRFVLLGQSLVHHRGARRPVVGRRKSRRRPAAH